MDMELASRMLDEVAAVPAGWVATYGDIAARAGSRSPRLAGRVLAELADATTPWHRIVRADGTTAAHLETEQSALLRAEGVQLVGGKVDLRRYRYRPEGRGRIRAGSRCIGAAPGQNPPSSPMTRC